MSDGLFYCGRDRPFIKREFERKGRSARECGKANTPRQNSRSPIVITMTLVPAGPETLRFGYGDTELGSIAVVESVRGGVALFLGDDRAQLLRDLERAFPNAKLVADETGLAQTVNQAVVMVNKPPRRPVCRLTCVAPLSNWRFGPHCGRSRKVRRGRTARSRRAYR